MANGNNATIGFEKQIWDAACVLWGHIPAAEYRKVIVEMCIRDSLLQRVNDDQLGSGMLGQKVRDLLLQPAADQPGGHGEIQVVRGAVGKIVEPVFDAALGVLKAQICLLYTSSQEIPAQAQLL